MTRKSRTILLLIFLILFILIAPIVVLYSQGYRFDFERKSLTQTGGFFLKIAPKQAEIYLDGKLSKKADFFFGSALIENLLPKKYKVEIKKQGYLNWEKTLEIKEKEVTEAKSVILFPKDPNFDVLTKRVKNLWLSPDQNKIVLLEEDKENWALKLYELDKNVKSHLIEERDISLKGADLFNLEFSEVSKDLELGLN